MDKITESLLNEFTQEHGLESLNESERFEHFAAYLVVRGEHSETFDTHDVVVGDESDTGIDVVAIIANGFLITDVEELKEHIDSVGYLDVTFVFVQATTSSKFTSSRIGNLGYSVLDFFSDAPKLVRNARVNAAAEIMETVYKNSSKFRRGNPLCKIFYVTTGKWNDDSDLVSRADSIVKDLDETGQFGKVIFIPLGASAIQAQYQRSRYATATEFTFSSRVTVPDVPNVEEAYLGFLPWSEFKKLIIEENGVLAKRLFFDNIRDWQGYNPVNSGIRDTLASEAKSQFILMNNGVTVIAKDVRPTGNNFTIEDYQIVNGCQTSHVLYDHRDSIDDSVSIPVRLISTKNEAVTKAIIKATNWQTEIKEEQLFALEEFPKLLEAYFDAHKQGERLFFERRLRQYESMAIEKTRVIKYDAMIKAFAAMFLNEPHRTTRNYKAVKAKLGTEIWAKDQRLEPYHVSALAFYKLEFAFRNKRLEPNYKPARFHILLALRILAAGEEMPALTANKMEQYCKPIITLLESPDKAEEYIAAAARIVETVAGGDFNRDNIRTEPFTKSVLKVAKERRAESQGS